MANIPAELRALPLEHVIGSPLVAAIKAQALAAKTTVDFIKEVGLKEDSSWTATDDKTGYEARYVEFKFDRVIEEREGEETVHKVVPSKLTVPLLSIVPIPFIRINDMTIDFEYQIRDVETSESTTETNISTNAKAGGWFYKVQLKGSFTYRSANKRETDRRSTLKITVNAVQDEIPEGLARVLDMLSDAMKVVPLSEGEKITVPAGGSGGSGGG